MKKYFNFIKISKKKVFEPQKKTPHFPLCDSIPVMSLISR